MYSSSARNVLLFVIRILLCVIMVAVSSICLIASKILWCTVDGLIAKFYFSERISRVHFVDDYGGCMFDAAVTGCVFAITILSFVFVIVIDTLNCFFVNITRSDMDFCLLFFVVEGSVNFLINAVILLVWLLCLIVAAFDFGFWVSSWRIWVAVAGKRDLREDS